MVIFFYFDKTIKVSHQEIGRVYEHQFDGVDGQGVVPLDRIYFSTPSDFHNHIENIKKQVGAEAGEVHVVSPEKIVASSHFPEHIGFQNLEEVLIKHQGKKVFRLAILNAMSNALGDHLIGMQAFDYFYDRLQTLMPHVELEITFYQINPYRIGDITKQWIHKLKAIRMLPSRVSNLMENDAFIDLGTLIMRDNFDNQPMIDFFLEALSIDPSTVPPQRKRIQYAPTQEAMDRMEFVFHNIRLRKRPVLLFHHTSTTHIREMTDMRARVFVSQLLENSDYFVVSTDFLEFSHERFRNLNSHSRQSVDNFAAIIANVDAVISVDTLTYHLADAFDVPTVVLFTTIEPKYRIPYYPFTEAIMLESQDGYLYGKHKGTLNPEKTRDEILYMDKKWAAVNVLEVLQLLEKAKSKKLSYK